MAITFHLRRVVPALRAAGLDDHDIAEHRCVQEFTYLLERAGAPLGYRFTWDLLGPFSESLAGVFEDADEQSVGEIVSGPLPEVEEPARKVVDLRNRRAEDVESDGEWLHLVSCVDFLEHQSGISLGNGSTPVFLSHRYGTQAIQEARRAVSEVLVDDERRVAPGC